MLTTTLLDGMLLHKHVIFGFVVSMFSSSNLNSSIIYRLWQEQLFLNSFFGFYDRSVFLVSMVHFVLFCLPKSIVGCILSILYLLSCLMTSAVVLKNTKIPTHCILPLHDSVYDFICFPGTNPQSLGRLRLWNYLIHLLIIMNQFVVVLP